MSLAVAALRLCAVKALDNATSAGARVFDSVVDPRALIGDEARPTIVVYTDSGSRRPRGRDIYASGGHVDLTIELFVARSSKIATAAADQPEFVVEYPATDAGHENRLRRLSYEIESVLAGGDGLWPDLWRRAIVTFAADQECEWDRGADSSSGARFNFLRTIYRVVPMADPVRGEGLPDGGFWAAFLDQAEADAELHDLARDWRALITTPSLEAWRARAAVLGLTRSEAIGAGLDPIHSLADQDDAAPPDIVIDGGGDETDA